jgi:putative ABC transport system substrate-binding protein
MTLVGILFVNDLPLLFETFRQTLQELGYAEGRNLSLEYRSAKGQPDQLGGLAAELVRLKVDVIFAPSTTAALAARRSTQTIPIVFATAGDPVGTGLVTSVAYPGGNVTGMSSMAPDLAAKRLEFLKQLVPGMSRVAFVWRDAPVGRAQLRQTEAAARALGIPVEPLEIRTAGDLEKVFQAAVAQRADALVVPRSPISFPHRARIADLALRHRLPAVYDDIEFAEAGGLMTYGPSLREGYRRAATFVDKILKGANPRNLPVEQPTKFELVLNTKTAKALGLTIPQSVLLRADQIIE